MSPLRRSVFRSLPYLIYIGLITAYYSSDFENLLWSNIGLPNLVYRNDYHDFTTFLRCDENRDVITRWYRELSLSPPSLLFFSVLFFLLLLSLPLHLLLFYLLLMSVVCARDRIFLHHLYAASIAWLKFYGMNLPISSPLLPLAVFLALLIWIS